MSRVATLDPHVNRLWKACCYLAALLLLGTAGYIVIERWTVGDGLYMTVITLATVGYGETHPLTPMGRLFTMALIACCVAGMTFFSAVLTSFFVERDLAGHFQQRRMKKMISELKNHTIVCGAGLMGQVVIEKLLQKKQPVVLIDQDAARLEQIRQRHRQLLTVVGEATNELILAEANILEARHVVAALDAEIDNLLVAITCKDMGHDIAVYARSNDLTIANRMRKAAVDEVISPCQISGERVAEMILSA